MLRHYYKRIFLFLVVLFCVTGHGDEPVELITRLKKLDGADAINAEVHIEDRTSRKDDKNIKPIEKGDFVITAGPNSLTITLKGKIPDTRIFRDFTLLRAGELAHYAPYLIKELEGLKLIENRAGTHKGISCRHWRLKSEEKQKKFGVSATITKEVELWIDSGGYPMAAVFKAKSKGRMLLFKFSTESVRNQCYKRVGNRLVLILDKSETDVNSKAGKEKRTITTTVEVK